MFKFWQKQKVEKAEGPVVDLIEESRREAAPSNQYVVSIFYGIFLHGTDTRVGYCDLRLGMNEELYYAGNIGYNIQPGYRGHHYAYEACLVLFRLAKQHGLEELIITCSPDNPASQKTLEKLDGEYLETTDVPSSHWLYKRGETVKRIYRYRLDNV